MKRKIIISVGLAMVVLIGSVGRGYLNNGKSDDSSVVDAIGIDKQYEVNDYFVQSSTNWKPFREKVEVKGIFLTGNTVSYNPRFYKLLDLANTTEINAMVIDVKDDNGVLTYKSDVKMAQEIGANEGIKSRDFYEKMNIILENDVYPIARIVTFKDKVAGFNRPDLAIKDKNGDVWKDNKGNAWLNPYNKESWEYPIQLAEEAALKGFKEIQFDYVRFPTDGNRGNIDYGEGNDDRAKAISEFLQHAKERIEPLGAYVSADVFGDIIDVKGDAGIGQHLETLTLSVDILSPMVYPSHYNMGVYGIKYPDSNPYEIIKASMSRAISRVDAVDANEEDKAILRPWLQDFSAPWLKSAYGSNYTPYGKEQVRAQIEATYDVGLKEWILWSAGNKYTEDALLKEEGNSN